MIELNLCIDIDGTVTTPYYWIKYANNHFNTNVKPEDVNEYEIHNVLGVSRKEYMEFYKNIGELMHSKAKLRSRAKRVLYKLSLYHNIFYVTAREERMTKVTYSWISKRNLPCNGLCLLGSHHKVQKAKELNCDIFIEDRYENALELFNAGFKVLLIDCNYNRYPIPKEIIRVKGWDSIYEEIEKYYYEKIKLDVA
ncbi:5' nucleotidase, NT5C type [Maledivibacter halophilus]|uniref:Nucleotidase n=1 Tax=Maledivibacter halophilus TaxID=36842 RepID=A0A1T5KIH6_9FIRM|nr:hypothetical protein [Maledivibacter halophilus]SKC63259.1 hypothetical protein SAMN02194393_01831 [Maledivibacter halophilus]